MNIKSVLTAEIPDTNIFHFLLEDYGQLGDWDTLWYGHDSVNHMTRLAHNSFLNITMPTEYCQKGYQGYGSNADEVYGICPYTVKWLNRLEHSNKYKYMFYPFHEKDIPEDQEKKYDVCYFGGMHSDLHIGALQMMVQNFNYRYFSMDHHINALTQHCLQWATDINLTHTEKIAAVGECKLSICFNMVPLTSEHRVNIQKYRDFAENNAFKYIDEGIMPQFKSRMHEAAIAKTLNLVWRDPWGIAEDYYKADEEFVYFDDIQDLFIKIQEILGDWDSYKPVVDAAFERAQSYTSHNLVEMIGKGLEWATIR